MKSTRAFMQKAFMLPALLIFMAVMASVLPGCSGKKEQAPAQTPTMAQQAPALVQKQEPVQSSDNVFKDGEWPDNELTRQVPTPPFTVGTIDSSMMVMKRLTVNFKDVTLEGIKAYREELRAAGFNQKENDNMKPDAPVILWNAENDDGSYIVHIGSNQDGTGFITIQKL
jgi:hypothetical protein